MHVGLHTQYAGYNPASYVGEVTLNTTRRKETHCEFCDCELPDWKNTLTPQCGANAPAVMNVNFDGRTYSFEVKPGPDGYRDFTQAIRRAFNLPEDSELNITFTCDEPSTGAEPEPMSPGVIPLCMTSDVLPIAVGLSLLCYDIALDGLSLMLRGRDAGRMEPCSMHILHVHVPNRAVCSLEHQC